MADLISGGVMRGLISASGAMKSADSAMSVYVFAKNKKDDAMMERAMGHMTDRMNDAVEATEESQAALAESIEAAREEARAEREAELERVRGESAENRERTTVEKANSEIMSPVDTVEISPEAIAALQEEQDQHTEKPAGEKKPATREAKAPDAAPVKVKLNVKE